MRSTLVISDIHLCPVDRRSECLSAHRRPENQPDASVALLLDTAIAKGASEIVLNGDVFDFDTSDCVHRTPRDLAGYLDATLTDHMRVLATLGRAVRSGVTLTFVGGNHDAALAYPDVRQTLASRIARAGSVPNTGVQFRTWLHRTPDGIVIEHGHVYDPLCVQLHPSETTIGAVIARRVNDVLPCLNPHDSNPTAMHTQQYLTALKCAMQDGSERLLETVVASAQAIRELSSVAPYRDAHTLAACAAEETGISASMLLDHAALFSPKLCLRDLLEDDAWHTHTHGPDTIQRQKDAADQIAVLHGARAVVMGHTHTPQGERLARTWFGNSGAWASEAGVAGPNRDAAGHFVWIESDGEHMRASMRAWRRRDTVAV